jgi:molybdopterin molybdotransferase
MSVVTFAAARRIVEEHARLRKPGGMESVPLLPARQRVLAAAIVADRDFPPFARATRDGYAVRVADLTHLPARLHVVGEIKAGACGEALSRSLQPDETMAIMTGAPVPSGADAVLMVEYAAREGEFMIPARSVTGGENIVPQGAEARAGQSLLAVGSSLGPAAIAVAASVGQSEVLVYRRPRVAILSTGDELVEVAARPGPSQIRNSNSYSLAAQTAEAGAHPILLPAARDEADSLRQAIAQGLTADLLVITGGVSMGKYDLVEQELARLHAEFYFTGVLIQPGRPVVFGSVPAEGEGAAVPPRLFFGLPGNPVSAAVTFDLFVRPVIEALSGATVRPLVFLQAKLRSEVRCKTGLTRFLPAVLGGEFEIAEVEIVRWQGSGDIAAAARANCYLVVPPERESMLPGELVSVLVHRSR